MNFQDLIYEWGCTYFTIPLCTLVALICIVLLEKHQTKRSIFTYYLAAYVALQFLFGLCSLFVDRISSHAIHCIELYADYIFTLYEFCVFIFFFKKKLLHPAHVRVVKILSVIFLVASILLLIKDVVNRKNLKTGTEFFLWEFQSICLLVPCALYFFETFKDAKIYLSREPSFWIVSGLSFFMISTLPFSMFSNYILQQSSTLAANFTAIFHIFYCILFMMITKAHFCKAENSVKTISANIKNLTA